MLAAILIAGAAFYEVFVALKTLSDVRKMRATMDRALGVVQSKTMSDEEKATAMRKSSASMFGSIGLTVMKVATAVAAAAATLYVVSLFAWSFDDLIEYSVKPLPLIATIIGVTLYGMIRHGRKR
ncbi:MAG TPA: hypothetical protein PKM48_11865 [Parvularculaceae bacterium]|nr:hypothetical protein [Parvularculaceae bacterium]HNS86977.1 hypothetical protein [Parvularculaceae bacterium]